MSIGTSTALLIGTGISAATGMIGAHASSSAASEAAKTQTASADKALALQKQLYDDAVARNKPYSAAGTSALGRLDTEFGQGGSLSTPWGGGFRPPGAGGSFANGFGQPQQPQRPSTMMQFNKAGNPANFAPAQGPPPQQAPPPQGGPGGGPREPMVLVQAPTGETMQLPMSKAQLAVQRGAKIVQGAQ